eukprot:GHVQ01002541.1.p1 GENE.GHVQ01002541.1~~GHVQ01002541.1.p1  ORF type:complete len:306 (-),score=60.18 GHVQ01002541.1:305-1222(-)
MQTHKHSHNHTQTHNHSHTHTETHTHTQRHTPTQTHTHRHSHTNRSTHKQHMSHTFHMMNYEGCWNVVESNRLARWAFMLCVLCAFDSISPAISEYANLCECICFSKKGKSTHMIPTTAGCKHCTAELCAERLGSECEGPGVTVAVHCLDRFAILSRLSVIILLTIIPCLLLLGFLMRLFPSIAIYFQFSASSSAVSPPPSPPLPQHVSPPHTPHTPAQPLPSRPPPYPHTPIPLPQPRLHDPLHQTQHPRANIHRHSLISYIQCCRSLSDNIPECSPRLVLLLTLLLPPSQCWLAKRSAAAPPH